MHRVGRIRSLAAAAGPVWWQRVDAGVVPFAARASFDTLAAAPHLSSLLHSNRLWPHAATRTLRTSVGLHQQIVTSGPRDVTLKKGSKLRVKVTHPPKAPTIGPSPAPHVVAAHQAFLS